MDELIKFLFAYVKILGKYSTYDALLSEKLPSSLYTAKKKLFSELQQSQQITNKLVCPRCYQFHCHSSCSIVIGNCTCLQEEFPKSRICNQQLTKSVFLSSGKHLYYPLKTFCYFPLKGYIQRLLIRSGFLNKCQDWMNRFISSGNLSDVYDGAIWKEHMSLTNPQTPNTLGLMLNIDWFKPFKHLTYSVGVIYMTIMNLPHFCHHKQENVLTLGIIPGHSKPKHDLNSFLNPIVTELLELEQGAIMTHSSGKSIVEQINIRCLLLAVACDLPAVRKTCGFLSHAAKLGCSKCLKEFPGKPGEMNYSGFDRSTWLLRSNAQHRRDVNKIRHAGTQKIRNSMDSDFGCRYSELLRLSYFEFLILSRCM